MFDVCTTGDTAHIDTIFKFLPHNRQHGCIDILHCCNDPCRARMILSVGGSFVYSARNALCTVTTDLLLWYCNTQNDFSPGAAIFSLQQLASPSGRNVPRNARCTVTTDLLVWYSNTQNDFSPRAAIFSLQTLASPSGRNVNYDKKNLLWKKIEFFLLPVQFRKHVSYGFPIINFCNTGVHYEKPCNCVNDVCPFFSRTLEGFLDAIWEELVDTKLVYFHSLFPNPAAGIHQHEPDKIYSNTTRLTTSMYVGHFRSSAHCIFSL
jgi:hypothetical protein